MIDGSIPEKSSLTSGPYSVQFTAYFTLIHSLWAGLGRRLEGPGMRVPEVMGNELPLLRF